jgi:hypothetical protein
MECGTFKHENNEGCPKRDLRFIRNGSGGENYDDRDEVEKVVIDQGCTQLFKINSLFVSGKILPEAVQNLYETRGPVKGNRFICCSSIAAAYPFTVQTFSG